jgi:hypothetical protein
MNGFPSDGFDALISAMADVATYPDDPLRTRRGEASDERWTAFGDVGMVAYTIDEGRRLVTITDVTWVG